HGWFVVGGCFGGRPRFRGGSGGELPGGARPASRLACERLGEGFAGVRPGGCAAGGWAGAGCAGAAAAPGIIPPTCGCGRLAPFAGGDGSAASSSSLRISIASYTPARTESHARLRR